MPDKQILLEKACRHCYDLYGCFEIKSSSTSVENDCERCDAIYRDAKCKLKTGVSYKLVMGECPDCRKKNY